MQRTRVSGAILGPNTVSTTLRGEYHVCTRVNQLAFPPCLNGRATRKYISKIYHDAQCPFGAVEVIPYKYSSITDDVQVP
jgi:hypothetical protein